QSKKSSSNMSSKKKKANVLNENVTDDHTFQFRNFGIRVMDVEEDVEELDDLINSKVSLQKCKCQNTKYSSLSKSEETNDFKYVKLNIQVGRVLHKQLKSL